MNEQDKQLLLKDLCARLPYGVKFLRESWNYEWDQELSVIEVLEDIDKDGYINNTVNNVEDIKPYLRSMSSMTKEEATTLATLWGFEDFTSVSVTDDCVLVFFEAEFGSEHAEIMFSEIVASVEVFDYLNSIYADYRCLIEKGLALPAPEGMYNTK